MNDLEDLVREELRARVDAAEASQPDEPRVTLLGALDRRIRRTRLRRRWGAAALSAVTIAAGTVVSLQLTSPAPNVIGPGQAGPVGSLPLTDTAATPRGWAAVAHGDAQISVPANWLVASTPQCGRRVPGYVVLGSASTSLVVRNPRCSQARNTAAIQVLPVGQDQTRHRSGQINGIPVLGVRPVANGYVSFLVPSLHVVVSASGPLADKVLGTLTRSPLSVVLTPGPRLPVPHSWRWHEFRGIEFAAPGGWALVRNGQYACPFGLSAKTVILVPPHSKMPRCAAELGTAGLLAGQIGLTAMAGPVAGGGAFAGGGCGRVHGLRYCYSVPNFSGGVLDVTVSVAGRQRTSLLRIGLTGTGEIPRTIVESIRPG